VITVIVNALPAAPTVTTPVTYCQNATAVPLTATGSNLLWYTVATGGTGSSTAPTPSTTIAGNTNYYVSQTVNGCEGPRATITVVVNATPVAPTVSSPVTYCQNATAVPLTATGSNLLWYTVATGGTGSSTAPTPNTTVAGSTNYYVSQTINGCEGPRATITVIVNATPAAPAVTTPVTYCQNATAVPLTATGSNLLWYTVATGGTGSSTAPTPNTTVAGSTNYYVSQTINGCEGPRALITVVVNATPAAPVVTTPVTYCQNATAVPLTATGSNLLWYTVATGGTGSSTAPIPSTITAGSTNYYVSQTINGCEGSRALIIVVVNPTPVAPVVTTPVTYCQNTTAVALTATGSNLLWYTVATGGTGSSTAPTPSTTTAGSTNYYVSQSVNGCESPRTLITVIVNAPPAAPVVVSPVNYCLNASAVALTATGVNLRWYTVATGGTGSATAPVPSTTTVGTTPYYVSQTINGCEGPRALINVNVTPLAAPPVVTTPVNYCQNTTAVALTATGNNLLWYIVASGGTGSSTAPIPSTTIAGNTNYYVSQSNNCGEGPRAVINVNIIPTPAPATGLTVTGITINSAVLNWNTAPGLYYTVDYKATTSATWINAASGITGGSIILTNLVQGTSYNWRVSANCSPSAANNYSSGQFSTISHNTLITVYYDSLGLKISPNPVLHNAWVDYFVPRSGTVTLSLVNASGQLLQTLFTTTQIRGQYVFLVTGQFDNLPHGTYFLRLQQNGKNTVAKFVKQ
jgi:Pyruvate/2-oxoacid:ferredoxin oxidoreductase gamma subunit